MFLYFIVFKETTMNKTIELKRVSVEYDVFGSRFTCQYQQRFGSSNYRFSLENV